MVNNTTLSRKFLSIIAGIIDILILPFLAIFSVFAKIFFSYKNPKIFMGTMCINNWIYIVRALRKRGYFAKLIVWRRPEHESTVQYDYVVTENKLLKILTNKSQHLKYPIEYLTLYILFLWSILKFNIFIMPFRGRILDRCIILSKLELPLLKLAGKKIILNPYGADIQTPRLTLKSKKLKYSLLSGYENKDSYYNKLDETKIMNNRIHCEKWADVIIAAIDHLDYLERVDFVLHMRCIDLREFIPTPKKENSDKIIILHATNHRELKGTEYIMDAVAKLRKKGHNIELIIAENVPHEILITKIREADIVIDQVLVGAYARFAIESMALEKPVICYLRDDLFKKNPIWYECPIVNANPDNLTEVLEEMIKNRKLLNELGKKGREYVEKYHSLEYIGDRLSKIIEKLSNL